jgi:hypothetical protein
MKLKNKFKKSLETLGVQIRNFDCMHMFLGLPDPNPDPSVRDTDTDPSIIQQKSKKNIDSYCFVTSFLTFYL